MQDLVSARSSLVYDASVIFDNVNAHIHQTQELTDVSYSEKPKYRCPRCQVQTCSLPCYKKHQQRASCNGKRDVAAYKKRSQLATPAGLDQDYNYLQQVERSMEIADREVHERGIGTTSNKNVSRNWQANSSLNKYLIDHSITIQRAPVGMSRQKNNNTRATKNGGIFWTVEWATTEKAIGVQQDCPEASSATGPFEIDLKTSSTSSDNRELTSNQDLSDDIPGKAAEPGPPTTTTEAVGPFRPDEIPPSAKGQPVAEVAAQHRSDTHSHQFFLLRPATISSSRVLIPLRADATLTESLEGQTVQEYPTIYVMSPNQENLPEGFMLEKDYIASTVNENKKVERTANLGGDIGDTTAACSTPTSGELDAQSILKMLKRDINR
ncbi:hypothetical protein M433DRAFT_106988 [Acidomyces richmondensis BFW]|nr:MAG: hypothetical protein FE78DRAFT_166441 [Acidomyces sp. 'richmondensis']KYG46078.1 hypothetical protein M433DRAFT_106988 [Acidomyces richmondensis BFW]